MATTHKETAPAEPSLLPRTYEEFRSREYWDQFFELRDSEAFEWYGEYADLAPIIERYVPKPADANAGDGSDGVLVVGCGNSALSSDMYDAGYDAITNIDFSPVVIEEMSAKTRKDQPKMRWKLLDMTDMHEEKGGFSDGAFGTVLDKGALDALMAEDTADVGASAARFLAEVERVLAVGGVYLVVTMAQEFILRRLLTTFTGDDGAGAPTPTTPGGWSVEIHQLERAPAAAAAAGDAPVSDVQLEAAKHQPFVVAVRRLPEQLRFDHESPTRGITLMFDREFGGAAAAAEAAVGLSQRAREATEASARTARLLRGESVVGASAAVASLLEQVDISQDRADALGAADGDLRAGSGSGGSGVSVAWALDRIADLQSYAHARSSLVSLVPGRLQRLDLWGDAPATSHSPLPTPRYSLTIVDAQVDMHRASNPGMCAVFIVPQGREHEWLFSDADGQRQLADTASFGRLVIVALCRGHTYGGMDSIQEELNPYMAPLLPAGALAGGQKVPYLTDQAAHQALHGDDPASLGERLVVHNGVSELSGAFVVEDVPDPCSPVPAAAFSAGFGAIDEVEEIEGSSVLRRLVFLDRPHVVQTEVKMRWQRDGGSDEQEKGKSKKKGKSKGKGKKKGKKKGKDKGGSEQTAPGDGALRCVVDPMHLAFDYHTAMVAGLAFVWRALEAKAAAATSSGGAEVMVIGLGGGALPVHLVHSPFLESLALNVTAVELDGSIATCAADWFGCNIEGVGEGVSAEAAGDGEAAEAAPHRSRLSVVVDDGLRFVARHASSLSGVAADGASSVAADPPQPPDATAAQGRRWDVVVLDVDSKDITVGMSCPPQEFVTKTVLQQLRAVLSPDGMLMINISARSQPLLAQVTERVRATFCDNGAGGEVRMVCPNERDVNRVIYALRKPQKKNLTKLALEVFGSAQHAAGGSGSSELLDSLTEYLHAADTVKPQTSDSLSGTARETLIIAPPEDAAVSSSNDFAPHPQVEELELDDLDAQD